MLNKFVLSPFYITMSSNKSETYLNKIIALLNENHNIMLLKFSFIDKFLLRNDLIWNDGFLIDFAQKKTADLWVRKFVILTGFLFSDRFVFDSITRIYNDNLVNVFHQFSSFDSPNVLTMFGNLFFFLSFLLVLFTLFILIF